MTKEQRQEIQWAVEALEQELSVCWEVQARVLAARRRLAHALDVAEK